MTDILTRDQIVAAGRATTRDEAIREAGDLLVSTGAVTPEYVDARSNWNGANGSIFKTFVSRPAAT